MVWIEALKIVRIYKDHSRYLMIQKEVQITLLKYITVDLNLQSESIVVKS